MNTMQEEFDAVVAHLYKQGKPAVSADGFCKYRTEDGLMCAVGCRIPDVVYKRSMEGKGVLALVGSEYSIPPEIEEFGSMFRSLQIAHDDWSIDVSDITRVDGALSRIAAEYSLTYNSPWKAEANT